MISDKQSLILSGFVGMGIFVFGLLDLLGNFVVLTLMTISFFAIVLNLVFLKPKETEDHK